MTFTLTQCGTDSILVERDGLDVGCSKFDLHGCLITLVQSFETWDTIKTPEGVSIVLPSEYRTMNNN